MLRRRDEMLRTLLPQFGTVVVESVDVEKDMLVVTARTRAAPAECPGCGQWSAWEHSRYVRHLGDEAVSGRAVRIDMSVRRLHCENAACPKVTFVEQAGGLTVRDDAPAHLPPREPHRGAADSAQDGPGPLPGTRSH